jgi:putative SbcD/Mre11-related phosphoesterase
MSILIPIDYLITWIYDLLMKVRTVPIYPEPALLLINEQNGLSAKRYIVVSDLHLGFENTLDTRGIFIDSNLYLTETINELVRLIHSYKPEAVILLGDLKSTVGHINKDEWKNVPYFLDVISRYIDIYFIPGNHDANIRFLIPDYVNVFSMNGMLLNDTLLLHGHTMPSNARLSTVKRIIMGHIHPVFLKQGSVLSGQRVWLYFKAKKWALSPMNMTSVSQDDELVEIVVIPAFNRYLYALSRKQFKKSISPIINRILLKNAVEEAYITTLDGSLIGDINSLHNVV